MSILTSIIANREKDEEKRLDQMIRRIKTEIPKNTENELLTYLTQIKNSEVLCPIKPRSLALDTLEMIMGNKTDFPIASCFPVFKAAERIYQDIFIYEDKTPDFDDMNLVFLEMFEEGGIVAKNVFRLPLFQTFRDKYNYITFMNGILNEVKVGEYILKITDYAVEARQFFIDDMEYCFHMLRMAKRLFMTVEADHEAFLEHEKNQLMRMNGIYDIDSTDLAKAEMQLKETKETLLRGQEVISQVDEKTKQLRQMMEEYERSLAEIRKNEENAMKVNSDLMVAGFKQTYEEMLRKEKEQLGFDREEFAQKMFVEVNEELERLRAVAKTIATTSSLELKRVEKEAESLVRKVDELVRSDVEVRRIVEQSDAQKKLMQKIERLSKINDEKMELLDDMLQKQEKLQIEEAKAQTEKTKKAKNQSKEESAPVMVVAQAPQQVSVSMIAAQDEVILPVNPLLDEKIPFDKRWEIVMEAKAKRVQNGEHFHEMFDDVLMAVMENANPYLIGPSGCGKTFMVNQISELLGVEAVDIGYINEEYELLGFQTANGGYSSPNFYRCYKYGRMAFCDELDNGNARATVKLNSFLSNSEDARYSFPNGETVLRHNNFRIIAAGNTAGNGADVNYNTREKIEESVQQRFTPIFVDYDNEVERRILKQYPDWFEFVVLFRKATSAWADSIMGTAPGIITTRDSVKIKKYLDHKSFSPEKIMQYEFIQTKEMDYLLFLCENMKSNLSSLKKATDLYNMFTSMVNKKRSKGGK